MQYPVVQCSVKGCGTIECSGMRYYDAVQCNTMRYIAAQGGTRCRAKGCSTEQCSGVLGAARQPWAGQCQPPTAKRAGPRPRGILRSPPQHLGLCSSPSVSSCGEGTFWLLREMCLWLIPRHLELAHLAPLFPMVPSCSS